MTRRTVSFEGINAFADAPGVGLRRNDACLDLCSMAEECEHREAEQLHLSRSGTFLELDALLAVADVDGRKSPLVEPREAYFPGLPDESTGHAPADADTCRGPVRRIRFKGVHEPTAPPLVWQLISRSLSLFLGRALGTLPKLWTWLYLQYGSSRAHARQVLAALVRRFVRAWVQMIQRLLRVRQQGYSPTSSRVASRDASQAPSPVVNRRSGTPLIVSSIVSASSLVLPSLIIEEGSAVGDDSIC